MKNSQKLNIILFKNANLAADYLVKEFNTFIESKPNAVLGFATGTTPIYFYKQLQETCKSQKIDWSDIKTFNLDEFIGVPKDHPESFWLQMQNNLFRGLNINQKNIYLPNGLSSDAEAEAKNYEKLINDFGGIDLQYISLGVNGHMAYNEPGTELDTLTHVGNLSEETRHELVKQKKFPSFNQTPKSAITVGVQTILNYKKVFMVIVGENKAKPAKLALEGPISPKIPASALQRHKNCVYVMDEAAASLLDLSKHNVFKK